MEWPSKNVPRGGILHPARATYSPDTKQFLNLLMQESRLSMMQRKKINYYLRNGDPLPNVNKLRKPKYSPHNPEVLIRPVSSKRRTYDSIINSGVYERDQFVPAHPRVDRDKEKQRLQDKMAYNEELGKKLVDNFPKKVVKAKEETPINRFDELVTEIKEREEWLRTMEEMGQGSKYRQIIQQQIEEKMREMNSLKSCDKK